MPDIPRAQRPKSIRREEANQFALIDYRVVKLS
jgi:hypothetical protein